MSFVSPSQYPRITIITPSYNQGQFIEETIQSVLNQGYPNLEYIIIDGGSTDQTVEIIKRYAAQIAYWVSEPDRGQTHAINKGLAQATGEILAYLNSDDYYLPGALHAVAKYFGCNPQVDLLHGCCRYVNEQGEPIGEQCGNIQSLAEILDLWGIWWKRRQFVQPEVFWTKRIADAVGEFREDLNYVMDYDYWCRILQAKGIVGALDQELSCFRFTANQKSNQSQQVAQELLRVVQPLLWNQSVDLPFRKRLALQQQWLHQAVFLKEVELSLEAGDRKVKRWGRLLKVLVSKPQILLAPGLHQRINSLLPGYLGHLFTR